MTDSSAEASPLHAPARGPVVDSANQASPIAAPGGGRGASLPTGESIPVHLGQAIDSGRLKNGQTVPGTLDAPVRTASGSTVPARTPVSLTVVATVPAGRLSAAGEFSLELVHVGNLAVFTDTQTFRGKPGHRDLPDSAASLGTDAGLSAGAKLTFHVQPPPTFNAHRGSNTGAGSVTAVVGGPNPPKKSTGGQFQPGTTAQSGSGSKGQVKAVQPADTTTQPAQNLGKTSVAPNQPTTPSQTPNSAHPQ